MTRREKRVINAFINCVQHGEYTVDYAMLLIEDNARYGWLSDAAKETFYAFVDGLEATSEPAAVETESEGSGFGM